MRYFFPYYPGTTLGPQTVNAKLGSEMAIDDWAHGILWLAEYTARGALGITHPMFDPDTTEPGNAAA
jgi:hypothetical protein